MLFLKNIENSKGKNVSVQVRPSFSALCVKCSDKEKQTRRDKKVGLTFVFYKPHKETVHMCYGCLALYFTRFWEEAKKKWVKAYKEGKEKELETKIIKETEPEKEVSDADKKTNKISKKPNATKEKDEPKGQAFN